MDRCERIRARGGIGIAGERDGISYFGGEKGAVPSLLCLGILLIRPSRKNMEEQEYAKVKEEHKRAQELEAEIMQQIEQDTRRKQEAQRMEKERHKARRRAMSDATEKPMLDVSTESFDHDIVISGARFNSVKLFHGRNGMPL